MTCSISFLVDPSPLEIAKRLRVLGREFRSWRPAWRASLPLLARGVRETVQRHGAPIGEAWAPLKAATLRRKARLGRGRGPLIGTGALLAAVSSSVDGGATEVKMTATSVRFGIRGLVPNVQHHGSEKRGIPARPFMRFSSPMEAAVFAAMDAHARALLRTAAAKMGATVT